MGKILFASNNTNHWGENTTAAASQFDPARVPYSIQFNTPIKTPEGIPLSTTGETWIHFRMNASPGYAGSSDTDGFYVRDDQERLLMVGGKRTNTPAADVIYYDTTGASIKINGGNIDTAWTWDIRIVHTAFVLSMYWYQNGILVNSHEFGSNPGNVLGISSFQFTTAVYQTGAAYMSEFIMSDSDTRTARLNMISPVNTGAYNDWIGLPGTLVDRNSNTGLTTNQVDQRSSLILEPYINGEIISNLVVTSLHSRGLNSPTKLRHFLRASAVDYDDANVKDVDFLKNVSITDYEINPATSLPWAEADLAATEFGFKSEL